MQVHSLGITDLGLPQQPCFSHCDKISGLTETKNCGEKSVANLKSKSDHPRLIVMFNSHRNHIEKNQNENGNLKPAIKVRKRVNEVAIPPSAIQSSNIMQ